VAAQRGDYVTARLRYGESLVIRQRHDNKDQIARLLANLAILAEYEGDFDESRRLNLEALTIREGLGDRWVIAMSQNNLGMVALHQRNYEEASERFEESIRLGREVGDPWVLALGDENRGNARIGLGDHAGAGADYAAALRAFMVLGDRYYSAFLLERIALLAAAVGELERAIELTGAADRLRDEIGAGRAPSLVEEIDRELEPARAALGPDGAAAALELGRTWSLEQAVSAALEVCEAANPRG
jgi:tetratricopeptide (TPR) repeat protein